MVQYLSSRHVARFSSLDKLFLFELQTGKIEHVTGHETTYAYTRVLWEVVHGLHCSSVCACVCVSSRAQLIELSCCWDLLQGSHPECHRRLQAGRRLLFRQLVRQAQTTELSFRQHLLGRRGHSEVIL